ncbi:MAG: FAD:protein FMN transferase [Myxococcota bacterium]
MGKPLQGFGLDQASRPWWLTLLVLVVASVGLYLRPNPGPKSIVLEGATMGTSYRVVVAKPSVPASRIKSVVQARLDRVVTLMSTYEPESELSRFNASRASEPWPVAPETRAVLEIALEVWRRSEGVFDVTVGPLVDRWGFGPSGRAKAVPSEEELNELLRQVGSDGLALTKAGLSKRHPNAEVDLSAVAKGYAVDLVSDALDEVGVTGYLVEVGGEVRTRGEKQAGVSYRVAIEAPDAEARRVHAVLDLKDAALATSGNYRNYIVRDGVKYAHALDPRTGRPVEHRLLSASVLHDSCGWADAWATALMVAGERAWSLAEANGLEVLLLYSGPEGSLEEKVTPGFDALRRALEQGPNSGKQI